MIRRPGFRASFSRSAASFAVLAGLLGVAAGALGCGPGANSSGPNRPLPAYAGRAADLFDDTIEPAAVGLDFDKSYSPKADTTLRERAQVSDAVVRVRVSTVTSKKDGPESTYQLGLHLVEKIYGSHVPGEDFNVQITKTSESHGVMKNFETRLVGYPFVAFVREFVRPDGDHELHFHLAPDTKEVKAAVAEAVILGEVKQ